MWKATIRGLFARKVRLALTALAILLGVAFVSATYVLTDSVKRSFESVFAQTLTGVDLRVGGASALSSSGSAERIPQSVTDEVAAVPGVRTAQGFVQTSLAQLVTGLPVRPRRRNLPADPPSGQAIRQQSRGRQTGEAICSLLGSRGFAARPPS